MNIRDNFTIEQWDFKTHSILSDLPPEDAALLESNKSLQLYRKGEIIFREGAFPSGIFYITRGRAKKYKADKDGREHIVYIASTGELIGFHALLTDGRYPDSAATVEDSLIAFIPREDFLQVLERSPLLNRRLLKALSHEFGVLLNSLSLFAYKSVRQRLALQLVILREKYKKNSPPDVEVQINLSRQDLAA